jgi:hypothetical protein
MMPTRTPEAFAALERAGVRYRSRKAPSDEGDTREIDIWLPSSDVPAADQVLASVGFWLVHAPAHRDHRFYVNFDGRSWTKIDAKLETTPLRARASRLRSALSARRPIAARRLGPVIAILYEDPSSRRIVENVAARIPIAVSVADPLGPTVRTRSAIGSMSSVVLTLIQAYAAAWRGEIVLHLGDWRASLSTAATGRLSGRVAAVIGRLLPSPDAVVGLDRAGSTDGVITATALDADQSTAFVSAVVWSALCQRRGWDPNAGVARSPA